MFLVCKYNQKGCLKNWIIFNKLGYFAETKAYKWLNLIFYEYDEKCNNCTLVAVLQ